MSVNPQCRNRHGKLVGGISNNFFFQWLLPPHRLPVRRATCRLSFECLEDRTLMSASIFGSVFHDFVGNGIFQGNDTPIASQVVFLDLNNDGKFGTTDLSFSASSVAPMTLLPGQLGNAGIFRSPFLQTDGLSHSVQNIVVSMDLTNNSSDAIQVALLSPLDITVPQVPVLFTIQPGASFVGTFDGNSTNPVLLANSPVPNGTYAPQMPFSNPQLFLENGDGNGQWSLGFFPSNPALANKDMAGLVLNSWSVRFTQAEPSTTTDAAGNYSFTGLAAGTYKVGLVHAPADTVSSAGGAVQTVTVADGQAVNGVNFGVRANPDVTGVSFSVASPATAWGQPITVKYTLKNEGIGDAAAFDVGLYLSSSGVIAANQPLLLKTVHVNGLAAGASTSGSVDVTLPGTSPFGTTSPADAYVGFVIDPTNTLTESASNQSNQGAGIDLARVGAQVNVPVTSGSGTQQAPSLAVDPTNARHLVSAYMDHSLLSNGYAGIGIAVSNDGGATWSHSSIPLQAGFDQGASDPTVAFDNQGNILVSFMAATFLGGLPNLTSPDNTQRALGFTSNNGIFVAKSTNGGLNWGAPVSVETNLFTGTNVPFDVYPSMAVDTTGSGGPNSIYVTWTRYYAPGQFPGDPTSTNGSDVMIAVSTDGGASFTTQLQNVPTVLGNKDYAVTLPASGTLHLNVSTSGNYSGRLKVRVLDSTQSFRVGGANQFAVSGDTKSFDLSGEAGQTVYLRISGDPSNQPHYLDNVDYTVQLLNGTQIVKTFTDARQVIGAGTNGDGLVSALKDPNAGALDQGTAGTGTVGLSTVTVGPNAVYVSTYTGGFFTVYVSFDGGQTFFAPNYNTYQQNPFNFVSTQVKTDSTLPNDLFRTLPKHVIAADPSRPGVLYAVAENSSGQLSAGAIAASGIVFAVSFDYGQSWTSNFTVGSNAAPLSIPVDQIANGFYPVLNDDNAGQYPPFAASPQSQVISAQAMPSISVDAQGRITVIWYDTRGDVSGQNLEVWGTVSGDGGQHFSPNFQISNTTFNPNAGAFSDANNAPNSYLGDQIGVVAANGMAYAVWTDTRNATQQVEFGSYSLATVPAAPADRFSPNNSLQTATPLGQVTAQQSVPLLTLPPGASDEWFSLQAGANHLNLSVSAAAAGQNLHLELTDAAGNPVDGAVVTSVVDASGAVIGEALAAPSVSGASYRVHVSASSSTAIHYTLNLGSLTADLGQQVEGDINDNVAKGGQNVYRLAAAVTGSLTITFASPEAGGSGLNVQVLAADGQRILASSITPVTANDPNATLTVPVTAGQIFLVEVSAADAGSSGAFQLHFVNLDPFEKTSTGTQATGSFSGAQVVTVPSPALANQDYSLTTQLGGNVEVIVKTSGGYSGTLKVRVIDPDAGVRIGGNQFLTSDTTETFALGSLAAGKTILVRLSSFAGLNLGDVASYSIQLINLDASSKIEDSTSDSRTVPGLPFVDHAVTVAVAGTLEVNINTSGGYAGNLKFRILNATKTARISSNSFLPSDASGHLSIPVTAGETVYLRVSGIGVNPGDATDYTMQLTNLDDAASAGITTLFFPTTGDVSALAAVKLTGSGTSSLLVSHTNSVDALGVLQGNGNGTFQPETDYQVGPGQDPTLGAGGRQFAVANLVTGSNVPDVIMPNARSADVSVLLGNGSQSSTLGAFQPERRFDAVGNPDGVVTGDFAHNGITDAIVLQNFASGRAGSNFAYLQGNGDGTFRPPVLYPTAFSDGAGPMVVGQFTSSGSLDVIVFSKNSDFGELFRGNGDGTFQSGVIFATGESVASAYAVDLNGDGHLDLITTGTNSGDVYVMLGNNDGTFRTAVAYPALAPLPGQNVSVNGLTVANFNSATPDIIVTAAPRGSSAGVVVELPGNGDGTFGAPIVLAHVGAAGQVVAGDFGNGAIDLAVADTGGITVIYGSPLTLDRNTTPAAARNLGNGAHLITQPEAIVSTASDAYFKYTVPTDAAGSGSQVVDISALFQNVEGSGLTLSVTGATQILSSQTSATGVSYQVLAPQGATLTIHVAGTGGSVGVYTLTVDVLTQVVSIKAESPFPGNPLTSLVVTLQGDRLDPESANNPDNYTVYRAGPDGQPIGAPIPLSTAPGAQAVVYDAGANVQVGFGRDFPTAVEQTITLLFDTPLTSGASYVVLFSRAIHTANLNPGEPKLIAGDDTFAGHPLVSVAGGQLLEGSIKAFTAGTSEGVLTQLSTGVPFLSVMHDNLGAQLDSLLSKEGDSPTITAALTNELLAACLPTWNAVGAHTSFLIIWLDPVSIQLADPTGARSTFSLQNNAVSNDIARNFVEVGGAVEVMVIAAVSGVYSLNVSDVQSSARGDAVLLQNGEVVSVPLTSLMRDGDHHFEFEFAPDVASSGSGSIGSTISVLAASAAGAASEFLIQAIFESGGGTSLVVSTTAEEAGPSGGLPAQTNLIGVESIPDASRSIPRLTEWLIQDGGVQQITDGVMEAMQSMPFYRAVRNLFGNPATPQPSEQQQQQAPEDQQGYAPSVQPAVLASATAPEAFGAEMASAKVDEDAPPVATSNLGTDATPLGRLQGLLIAGALGFGAAFGLAPDRREEKPRKPKLK